MRKILLATTALVAFAGAAQAAESPLSVNVGGYVDFRAAQYHEATNNTTTAGNQRTERGFEQEFQLNVDVAGKAANGIEYGGNVALWNGAEYNDTAGSYTGGNNNVRIHNGSVWLSGAFGKVLLGDHHSANVDMFVSAPTVGEGQINGTFTDFLDPTTFTNLVPTFVDNDENSNKITYYTPKVGNDMHKVQLGVSYTPDLYNKGQNIIKYSNSTAVRNGSVAPYIDVISAAANYYGNFGSVGTTISGTYTTGSANGNFATTLARSYSTFGLGAEATYAGFTFGGSYVNAGRYMATEGQNKAQEVYTLGVKYGFDKVELAVNALQGSGYNNGFSVASTGPVGNTNYVRDLKELGLGATYTWFPGLTTNADAVFFRQNRDGYIGGIAADKNDGHVIMISQKLTF